MKKINVTVWNEFRHEIEHENIKKIYPDGIHAVIADFLGKDGIFEIKTATLDQPEHGLTEEVLNNTDVLIWWGHCAHGEVADEVAQRVQNQVLKGMGLIVLHSGHHSKPFKLLMGTSCNLLWRDDNRERVWCCNPGHPIAQGVPIQFELEEEEMYGECFDIPQPDELIYIGWFNGGEVFRSGCTFTRGYGKVFYFQPGHEAYPIYYNENIQKIITNAAKWAAPGTKINELVCFHPEALEK